MPAHPVHYTPAGRAAARNHLLCPPSTPHLADRTPLPVLALVRASLTLACAAETNFKTQVEADIQPFRGILLGLFFVTTGSSLDVG